MEIVKHWADWKFLRQDDGGYQLSRFDRETGKEDLQILFKENDDAAALVESATLIETIGNR